jgi:CPA2 family monovalent cation:H+ antiporter-2
MISFREIFASLFFVSVGMLLSPETILSNLLPIIAILAAVLVGKSAIVFITALVMRMPLRICLISAFALAQVGEFSLILLYAMQGTGLVAASIENNLVSAAILSMLITPFFMTYGPRFVSGLGKFSRLRQVMGEKSMEDVTDTVRNMSNHIVVAGYGFAGKELSQVLVKNGIPYIIVDLNIDNVGRASREVGNAVFGDITSETVLTQLGIRSAQELVLLINDPAASEQAVRVARAAAPHLFITVRTTYLLDVETLLAAGANEVIPAEREAAVQVMTQVMKRQQVDLAKISQQTLEVRDHLEEEDS